MNISETFLNKFTFTANSKGLTPLALKGEYLYETS